ncbi:MAG TPA: hypothetical protein VFU79_03610 [Nitrososphaeraceae archaeon]|nr:hypothetical protein [Nitrososphaeraceae archaeon]
MQKKDRKEEILLDDRRRFFAANFISHGEKKSSRQILQLHCHKNLESEETCCLK